MKSLYTDDYKKFTSLLQKYRERKGLKQDELAKLLQKDQTLISRYENGQVRLDFIQVRNYLNAMGYSLPDFVREFEKFRLEK